MAELRVYLWDGSVVRGPHSRETWATMPDDGVQVVALMEPGPAMGWSYRGEDGRPVAVRDRQLWTGDDEYDPFGWGPKRGSLIPDADYWAIWRRACTDPVD